MTPACRTAGENIGWVEGAPWSAISQDANDRERCEGAPVSPENLDFLEVALSSEAYRIYLGHERRSRELETGSYFTATTAAAI